MTLTTYQLANGERVDIRDDVTRGASVVSYTLKGGRVVDAVRCALPDSDDLELALDKVAVRVEALLRERAHIIAVLTAFYKSDISMSSLQPILDISRELNPDLDERRPRVPSHHLDEVSS